MPRGRSRWASCSGIQAIRYGCGQCTGSIWSGQRRRGAAEAPMRAILLLLTVTLALPGAALAAGKLYKWTDQNGVTHYTDEPPVDQGFETRPVAPAPEP